MGSFQTKKVLGCWNFCHRRLGVALLAGTIWVAGIGQMPPMTPADQAKLDKAGEMAAEADKLIVEANDLYLEASMARQSGDDAGEKQGTKLDAAALKKELEAAKTYEEANKTTIGVYQGYIDKFNKGFSGDPNEIVNGKLLEENAGEYFFRAKAMREEANASKGTKDSYYKLTEANEVELMGIEKLKSAYDFFSNFSSGISYPDEPVTAYAEPAPAETTVSADSTPADLYSEYADYIDTPAPGTDTTTAVAAEPAYDYGAYTPAEPSAESPGTTVSAGSSDMSAGTIPAATTAGSDLVDYSLYAGTESYGQGYTLPLAADSIVNGAATAPATSPAIDAAGPEPGTERAQVTEEEQPAYQPETLSATSSTITTADGVVIDQALIRQYQKLLNDTGTVVYPEGYTRESLIAFLEAYRTNSLSVTNVSDEAQSITPVAETAAAVEEALPETTPEQGETPADPNTGEIGRVTNAITAPDDSYDIIYKVQVAANRAPLSQHALRKMYMGNKGVDMIVENGWYKYAVGDFETFAEADNFKRSSGLNEAFVVAYKRSKQFSRVEFAELTTSEATTEAQTPTGPCARQYRIQIGASVSPLLPDQVKSLYRGAEQVDMYQEDGWYKYVAGRYCTYDEARTAIHHYGVTGAFVIAMEDGRKVSLLGTAASGFADNGQVIYVVQLAASLSPLTEAQKRQVYRGDVPLKEIQEEGWYKYQIEVGNSFREAMRVRNLSGTKGAFVVAYRNGVKIKLSEAMKSN